jgi:hypothetical protein
VRSPGDFYHQLLLDERPPNNLSDDECGSNDRLTSYKRRKNDILLSTPSFVGSTATALSV